MDSLYILIPIALIFVGLAIKIFLWAVDSDQFDDLDVAAQRILFDDDVADASDKPSSDTDKPNDPHTSEPDQPRE